MATYDSYTISDVCKNFSEAIRNIPGYDAYNPDKEVKALIKWDKTKDNMLLRINENMLTKGKLKKGIKPADLIKGYIRDRFQEAGIDRTVRKDQQIGSIILTMPRDYIDYDFGLTEEEAKALVKYNEYKKTKENPLNNEELKNLEKAQEKVISDEEYIALSKDNQHEPLNDHEKELVLSAKEKIKEYNWNDEQKARIKDFFEKSIKSLCKTCGIKEEDILYASVHMDEDFPHMHFSFIPFNYGKKLKKNINVGEVNYEVAANERCSGCSISRFDKGFLHFFNKNVEEDLKKQKIIAHIANGKGQQFKVSELDKETRRKMAEQERTIIALEQCKTKLEQELADAKEEIDALALYKKKLEKEIKELTTQNEDLQEENLLTEQMLQRINDELTRKQTAFTELLKSISDYIDKLPEKITEYVKGAVHQFRRVWNKETSAKLEKDTKHEIIKIVQSDMDKRTQSTKVLLDDDFKLTYQQEQFAINGCIKIAKEIHSDLGFLFELKDVQKYVLESYSKDSRKKEKAKLDGDEEINKALSGQVMKQNAFDYVMNLLTNSPEKFDEYTIDCWNPMKDDVLYEMNMLQEGDGEHEDYE